MLVFETVTKSKRIVTKEIPNIVSYDSIATIKEGKFTNNYVHFKQKLDNCDYSVITLKSCKCKPYHTTDNKIKIVKHYTEYTSPYRYFAYPMLGKYIYYDVYLPDTYFPYETK